MTEKVDVAAPQEITEEATTEENGKVKVEDVLFPEKKKESEDSAPEEAESSTETKEESDTEDDDSQSGAPEEYEDFKVAEGIEVNEEVAGEFKALAKELNLSQEAAQKIVDMQQKLATQASEQVQEHFTKLLDEWRESATNDKEYGGESFKENLGFAKKALDEFATDEFKKTIEASGFGNNPELIRLLYRVGKAMSEDKMLSGGQATRQPRDRASILFPDMAQS